LVRKTAAQEKGTGKPTLSGKKQAAVHTLYLRRPPQP
jgi:hypothetical protein